MIRPYWSSEDRRAAWGLLLAVVLLTLGMVYINVLFNQWNNAFFSALQEKNQTAFLAQLIRVSWLIAVFIILAVYQLYLNQMLEIRWRRWLTDRYLRAWLVDGAYYRMQLVARETDNPDQRIAEDLHLLASHTLGLFVGGLRAGVTLATFVAILWGLSGTLTIPVGEFSITLPGYMVWVAVLYAIAGTWLTDWIGRPLVRLNFDRQRYEADFRFSLVRFRENTEGVALYRGEADELRGFRERFEEVVGNWWGIMRRQKRLTYFTSGYGQAAWIVPSVVAAPRYFRGELGLGGLMQTIGAFQQVQDALSFFVQSYKEIAAWSSVVERLAGFERALEHVHLQAASAGGVRRAEGSATHLTVEGVDLYLPDGQPLLANVNLSLLAGRHRAAGRGVGLGQEHARPCHRRHLAVRARQCPRGADARVLFLPQRPYLPIGTLRDVVTYPMPAGGVEDAALREALEAVGLAELAGRLDEVTTLGAPALTRRAAAHRLRSGPVSRSPTGSSSTRRPRRWTRQRRRTSIGWSASGSQRRRCSASAIGRRCAHSTRACSWCSAAEAALGPSWKWPARSGTGARRSRERRRDAETPVGVSCSGCARRGPSRSEWWRSPADGTGEIRLPCVSGDEGCGIQGARLLARRGPEVVARLGVDAPSRCGPDLLHPIVLARDPQPPQADGRRPEREESVGALTIRRPAGRMRERRSSRAATNNFRCPKASYAPHPGSDGSPLPGRDRLVSLL